MAFDGLIAGKSPVLETRPFERRKTRVLVVDDSAIVRKVLTDTLSAESDIEVIGTAPDPYVARDKILSLQPDVLTLDIEMPRMDGLTFLKKLMQFRPMPVIVISSLAQSGCQAAIEALRLGAVDVVAKPGGPFSIGELKLTLASKIRAAASARPKLRSASEQAPPAAPIRITAPSTAPLSGSTLIAIGASTGGTEAIQQVLESMPENSPPIAIVQHIPAGFSRAFAERLNQICSIEVKEACDGNELRPGRALLAPGNFHMVLRKVGDSYCAVIKAGPLVCYQRPSVDVFFSSVAEVAGAHAVGVLLTGMGADGARGMLRMKSAGARTIAQDEASCVVFGMPKEAIALGAAERVLPLSRIPSALLSLCAA